MKNTTIKELGTLDFYFKPIPFSDVEHVLNSFDLNVFVENGKNVECR